MTADIKRLSEALVAELTAPIDPRSIPVRFSRLRSIGISPAHYWHAVQQDRPDTLAMRLGRGVHSLLLDQPDRVVVFRGKTRQGKNWDSFEAAAKVANQEILNEREHAVAVGIARSVRSHADASRLLFDGTVMESRIEWTHMGRACQSTPDAFGKHGLVELKTCRSANPDQFVRSATFMNYHAQLAFYRSALIGAGFPAPSEAFIVAVESTPPHPVTVLRVTDRALDYGDRTVRLLFERLLQCEATNVWPGYVQSIVDFDVADDPIDELVFGEDSEAA